MPNATEAIAGPRAARRSAATGFGGRGDTGHRAGFCRLRHSRSSGLQLSSPRPTTNTSSQDSAFCASGVWLEAASPPAASEAAAAELALVPELAAAATDTPMLLTSGGTPTAVPPTWMLSDRK